MLGRLELGRRNVTERFEKALPLYVATHSNGASGKPGGGSDAEAATGLVTLHLRKRQRGQIAPFASKHLHCEPRIISACAAAESPLLRAARRREDSAYPVRE